VRIFLQKSDRFALANILSQRLLRVPRTPSGSGVAPTTPARPPL
jgi:hypothetical protein